MFATLRLIMLHSAPLSMLAGAALTLVYSSSTHAAPVEAAPRATAAFAPMLFPESPGLVEPPLRPREQGMVVSEPPTDELVNAEEPILELGGALRFNLFARTWDRAESVLSGRDDVAFDTFRLNVDSYYSGFHMSAEYRVYAGYHMLHHGYVSYIAPQSFDLGLGVMRAPFGILPYASHNFFFGLTYYVGLEDDYDLGVRGDFALGPIDVQLAYFRNDEGSYSGASTDSARYSYDVVRVDAGEIAGLSAPRRNEEKDQGNVRAHTTFDYDAGTTEFGVSGQLGAIQNEDTDRAGLHWAAAAHLQSTYGPFDLQLQYAAYRYDLENPAGQDERFIVLGAYDAPYRVAAEGAVLSANLAYRWDIDAGPLDSLTFYNDYSWLKKAEGTYRDTQQNVTGTLVHSGPVYAYFDVVLGKNHPWIGPSYGSALAEGNTDDEWQARLNVNIGYYF